MPHVHLFSHRTVVTHAYLTILITKIVIVQNGNQKIEKFNLFLAIMLFFMDESYDS